MDACLRAWISEKRCNFGFKLSCTSVKLPHVMLFKSVESEDYKFKKEIWAWKLKIKELLTSGESGRGSESIGLRLH